MENELEATGERFIPAAAPEMEIRMEHFSRYLLARDLARGKDVLDVASGEGYGSNLLAETARQVWGVDISQEAVDHAAQCYPRNNLHFLRGDAVRLPLLDHSVDLVVSFETIEHLSRQQEMIEEIRRVLRPGGKLLISSPDRENYDAIQHDGQNPFHVHELSGEEFADLLQRNFRHVRFARQDLCYSSTILWEEGGARVAFWRLNGAGEVCEESAMPVLYWLALASDRDLETPSNALLRTGVEFSAAFRKSVQSWEAHLASVQSDYQNYIDSIRQSYKAREESLRAENSEYVAQLKNELQEVQARMAFFQRRYYLLTHPHVAFRRLCVKLVKRPVLAVSKVLYSALRADPNTWRGKIRRGLIFLPKHLFPRQYASLKIRILLPTPAEAAEIPLESPCRSLNVSPLVTVIVPNYNHAAFLPERLDSIYNQSYRNFEVLLLDDCSSDNSREVLQRYAAEHPDNTRLLFNEKNSGSPFAQWKKGIANAHGELIWIAESDDWCDLDFLEKLVCAFSDESVMLAFARSVFVRNGKTVWTHEEYLSRYGMERWRTNFVAPAHRIVNECFGYTNIVPNVSSAVFRTPSADFPLWDDEEWSRMRVCGDWVFYLHLIRGGKIAYFGEVSNYYRQHENNTSVTAQQKDHYYAEHVILTRHVLQNYRMKEGYEQKQKENLRNFWTLTRGACTDEEYNSVCHWDDAFRAKADRKPNVFMFLFSFSSGGGEVFPIHLANELKRSGYGVTLVNCELAKTLPEMRRMVHRGIPVLSLHGHYAIGNAGETFGAEILHTHHASVDFAISKLHEFFPYAKHVVTTHGMYETMHPQDIIQNLPIQMDETACWCYIADKNLIPLRDYLRPETFLRKLPNGLEIQEIHPVERKTLGIPQSAFVFCLVSRGLPEKGWQEAIDAMQLAQRKVRRKLHLLLLGDGPMYEKLKDAPPPQVHVLGFKPNVRDYFSMADMGLLPSRFSGESFPLVLIECLLSGRPAIASDLGEIRNILSDEQHNLMAGLIFSLENGAIPVEKLAELMVRSVQDQELYQQMIEAVPLMASRVDIVQVARQYGEVYAEAISGSMNPVKNR